MGWEEDVRLGWRNERNRAPLVALSSQAAQRPEPQARTRRPQEPIGGEAAGLGEARAQPW